MSKKIIERGIEEAYELLTENLLDCLSDDLNENYNHVEYLDFSDEVFEYIKENGAFEILEPAIVTILDRVREGLAE